MKQHFVFALLLFFSISLKAQIEGKKIIDLSYTFDEETIFWPTEKGFQFSKGFEGYTDGGYFYSANTFCTAEHGGTHIDAPVHFYEGRNSVEKIPLEDLIGTAIVVDVSDKCELNRDHLISLEDFHQWEKKNGEINERTIVLLRTGFGKYWPDREKYMGTNERGEGAVAKLHFPGLHPEAAKWLAETRKIKAVGIDTPSIDYGQSTLFETHVILGKNNIPIFENVANLHLLPEKEILLLALPIKIKGGSGGPARIIALID